MSRGVSVTIREGKRGTTYRLRWYAGREQQGITVHTEYDCEQAVDAIMERGCNILDDDPLFIGGRLWRGELDESEQAALGLTFLEVGKAAIKAKRRAQAETKARNLQTLEACLVDLHDLPIGAIDADTVQAWLDDQGERFKPNTVRQRGILVLSVLRYAHRTGLRGDYPGPDVVLPAEQRRAFHFTDAQVERILAAEKREVAAGMWHLMAYTGLRVGEVLALRVGDVKLDHKRGPLVHVQQSTKGSTREIGPGKSKHANRKVLVDDATGLMLRRLTEGRADDELVWPHEDGGPLPYQDVNYWWRITRRRAKVPAAAHIHDLRHWHLSGLMGDPDVPLLPIVERSGHGSSRILVDMYGHTDADTDALVVASVVRARRPRLSVVS